MLALQTYWIDMAEEQPVQDSSVKGPPADQPFTVEASQVVSISEENSKPTANTQVKRHSSLSEGSNNKSSQISDTESMDRGQLDNEEFDNDVEPDSIPSNVGSAFAEVPGASYAGTLKYSQDQSEIGGVFTSESSMPARGPLTDVQLINEMYRCRRWSEEANHLKTIEIVSTLMQETERLSLQNKDLKQQVKLLKGENNHLRMPAEGVLEEQNKHLVEEVNQLRQNMKHTAERMYYYQDRCEKYELLQAERVSSGPGTMPGADGSCGSPPYTDMSEEPDAMPCLQDPSSSPPGP